MTRRKPTESRILERILGSLMQTTHSVLFGPTQQTLTSLNDGSVDLVVTSPPYPMIEMWDAGFAAQQEEIVKFLGNTCL